MTRWRLAFALVLLGVIGVPAAMPFLDVLGDPHAWQAWAEAERLASLAGNTLVLVAGSLSLALPAGVVGAVLLYRTDLPFRRGLRFLTLVTLFIPLPLFTSAWQAALGTGGWLPLAIWSRPAPGDPDVTSGEILWKPWAQGFGAAVWVHAVSALPWVIVLVGQGLCWVERELEEDALTVAGPWRVLRKVTLLRSRAAVCAAGLWVGLFTMTEITVTDMMQVRTFAEEVYSQFVAGDRESLARAVAVSIPPVCLICALVLWVVRSWEKNLPPLEALRAPPCLMKLGKARWPLLCGVLVVAALLVGVPVASLMWKAGMAGSPQAWSAEVALGHLRTAFRVRGGLVVESILLAATAGAITAGLSLIVCWLGLESRWFRAGVVGLIAVVWALSAPLIGIGLKQTIDRAMDLTGSYPLAVALYYGPSPVPVVWAHLIRFFPCAVAILWPVVRLFPVELREAARVDGARPAQELRRIILPLTAPACLRAGGTVAILSLGELGASKLVETPGSKTFAHEVFNQMHYGISNDLAALCILLLGVVVIAGAPLVFFIKPGARDVTQA